MHANRPQKLNLFSKPTPLEKLNRYFNKKEIWIKRDDLTGLELGGNKIRKLEFLLQDAITQNKNRIITCGGIQSNHCRATAFACARLGLKSTLFLKGQQPKRLTGNYFLNRLVNADVIFVSEPEYADIDNKMKDLANSHNDQCYVIPEGGSNSLGMWGYIDCFSEISDQINKLDLKIDTILVPTGSGGTHAGLLAGQMLQNSSIEIASVNVCDSAAFFQKKISEIIKTFSDKFGYKLEPEPSQIRIYDGFTGKGYGLIDDKIINLIKKFAQSEGIVLDPVYTAKAFDGLWGLLKSGEISGKRILFIHTGGIFGIFDKAEMFF